MREIRVTCKAADILPIDELLDFQGDLKHITADNLLKLKRSILKYGFTAPIFVWRGVDNRVIDGHQRLRALEDLRKDGYSVPDLPVAYIQADSEAHAKEKLLHITSQYGEFDIRGVESFMSDAGLTLDDVPDIRFSIGDLQLEVPDFGPATEEEQGKLDELAPKPVTCPQCGLEFDAREQA